MKRIFTFGLMLASVFALTNCTEELVDQTVPTDEVTQETVTPKEEGIPFQVYASLGAETKTEGYIDDKTGKLKTRWVSTDKIHVFYEDEEGTLVNAGVFTVSDTDNGIFNGFIPSNINPEETYNWYFVYDATKDNLTTTSNEGVVTATVTIGSSVQTQSSTTGTNDDVAHIGAANCPMWGKAANVSGSVTPRVQMTHLAALYEITIQNKTKANSVSGAQAGSILVKDVGIRVSSTGTWLSKNSSAKQKALVGDFTLDILNGTLSQVATNENYSVKLKITENPLSSIISGSEKKYYFVTAPVDIQNDRTTDPSYYEEIANPSNIISATEYQNSNSKSSYRVATKRQDIFAFHVNGSARTIPAKEEYNQDIRSGKVYEFILPVHELCNPLVTNGFYIESAGRKGTDEKYTYKGGFLNLETKEETDNSHIKTTILSFTNSEDIDEAAVINGSAPGFIRKLKGGSGQIIIDGFAKDMINAMPISFYASGYNDNPTAMTIGNINLWVPTYNQDKNSDNYTSLKYRKPVYRQMGTLLSNLMSVLKISADGIPRSALTAFVDENTITFNNIVSNGDFDSKNVIVMDENATHKGVTAELVDSFISRFSAKDESGQTRTASYYGLYAILNATLNSDGTLSYNAYKDASNQIVRIKRNNVEIELNEANMAIEADNTANGIYYKIYNTINDKIGNIAGGIFSSMGEDLVNTFFTSPLDLRYKLRDMRFRLTIETYPYAEKYPTSSKTYGPMVFWGMHYGGTATDYSNYDYK